MIEYFSTNDVVLRIAELLIGSFVAGIGLFLILLFGKRFIRRLNAATQYAVAFSSLVAVLLITLAVPLFSFIEFETPVAGVDEAVVGKSAEAPGEVAGVRQTDPIAISQPARSAATSTNPPAAAASLGGKLELPGTWIPLICGIWLLGAAFFTIRFLLSLLYSAKLKRESKPIVGPDGDRLAELINSSSIKRRVAICTSEHLAMPVAVGFFKPAVVIPSTLKEHLSSEELDQVVLHELAHFKRNDDWAKLFQHLIQIPFFFHPAVQCLSRMLDFTREVACDDWLISQRNEQRESYSEALCKVAEWNLAERQPLISLGLAPSHSQIESRIRLVLDRQREILAFVNIGQLVAISLVVIAAVFVIIKITPGIGFSLLPSLTDEIAATGESQDEDTLVAQAQVVSAGTVPDVLFSQRAYVPINLGLHNTLNLHGPIEAKDWWLSIETIEFPELPQNIFYDFNVINLGRVPAPVPIENVIISLFVEPSIIASSGIYEITKLHASDYRGTTWEIPLGLIRLDIRPTGLTLNQGPALSTC